MRYDEYDEYNGRYPRGNSRSSGDRNGYRGYDRGQGRDYDRGYGRDYDRGYDRYRDYDRGREYDRGYDQGYVKRDRFGTPYRDFEQEEWERTAPNWDDHGNSRSRSSGRSSGSRGGSSSGGSRRSSGGSGGGNRDRGNRPPPPPQGSGSRRRSPEPQPTRRSSASGSSTKRKNTPPPKRKGISPVPIVIGVVVIIMALLVIKSFTGSGKADYKMELSTNTIVLGETAEATITGIPEGTETGTISWSSNDNNVVTVSGEGTTATLTGKGVGQATIAANIDGKTVSSKVEVAQTAPGVLNIELDDDEITIRSGETRKLTANVQMEEGMTPAAVTWSSQNSAIVRIDEDGTITGRDVGKTVIKATAGKKTKEMVVNVVENPDATAHDPTQDTGNAPEEGVEPPDTGATGSGTGGSGTGTGTGSGSSGGSGTGTGSGSSGSGSSGTGSGSSGSGSGGSSGGTGSGDSAGGTGTGSGGDTGTGQ